MMRLVRMFIAGIVLVPSMVPEIPAQDLDRTSAYSPEAAAKRMTPAAGLRVAPYASEPLITQPVCIEFDDRGRLWAIQYLQYPNPAGLSRVKVDRFSRTIYDRRPEPPPRGPKGNDRITILENTDNDGVADRAKDFATGLNLTSGIAFGHGGVFVLQVPYLLFYPDKNRDDVPDDDPEVLLTGFGMEDAHSVANSLTWGPDGWLYGLQGSTVTANIRGIEFQQGIWRYHPITKEFELFAEGGGNMWGLDFDRQGRLFVSTNVGGFVMLHAVQGGYYWKSFGKHGPLHNPYTFGYFDHIPHTGARGGHVSTGGTFYQADELPKEFRGRYLAGNLLSHNVAWHTISPRGSTFAGAFGGILLESNDPWFAPCDLTVGPDGAVYVSDWHDKRTAHPDPDADWDRSNGRVYRISNASPTGARKPPVDLAGLPSPALVDRLHDANLTIARKARRILGERKEPAVAAELRKRLDAEADAIRQLELFWAIHATAGLPDEFAAKMLAHPNDQIRAWTVRLIGDRKAVPDPLVAPLQSLATSDASVDVRLQLAASARRLPASQGLPILGSLVLRDLDGSDPFLPLMLWWGVEAFAVKDRAATLATFANEAAWKSSLARQAILGRLLRRYASESNGGDACVALLNSAPDDSSREMLLQSLEQTIAQPRVVPSALKVAIANLWSGRKTDTTRLRLACRVGVSPALHEAMVIGFDTRQPTDRRRVALELLGESRDETLRSDWLALATGPNPPVLQGVAMNALARFQDASVAEKLIAVYADRDASWQAKARDVVFRRADSARAFIDAANRATWPLKDVTIDEVARLADHKDERLDAMVKARWGSVAAATPEEKLAVVRRLNNDVRAGDGDPRKGRELFRANCATCHNLFGEGNAIGPELTHANRKDRQFLLVSLVDPSGVVRKEYQSFVVATRDGRVLNGLIVEQTPTSITLVDAKNQKLTLSRDEVEDIKDSPKSLMPEGLDRQFTPAQLRDLFSYLQGDGPR